VDPVQLFNGKLKIGKAEFPCAYAGRVFLFLSEENQKAFEQSPRKYINLNPKMPQSYNLAIVGQRQAGKKSLAKILSQKYGWRIVDPVQIASDILDT
jgi:YHS domain-containing protein